MPGEPDPTTQELRLDQLKRERELREAQQSTPPDDETGEQLAARADKARYLREKLDERAAAERDAD